MDIEAGDVLVVEGEGYLVVEVQKWFDERLMALSAQYFPLACTTRRRALVNGRALGQPVEHLAGLKCSYVDPYTEGRLRPDLGNRVDLYQVYLCGDVYVIRLIVEGTALPAEEPAPEEPAGD